MDGNFLQMPPVHTCIGQLPAAQEAGRILAPDGKTSIRYPYSDVNFSGEM